MSHDSEDQDDHEDVKCRDQNEEQEQKQESQNELSYSKEEKKDIAIRMRRVFKSLPGRSSHMEYFHGKERNWEAVRNFWSFLIKKGAKLTTIDSDQHDIPDWALGEKPYGVTNIRAIHECAATELDGGSRDMRGSKRKTFALRIGYDGSQYQGYQSQGGTEGVITVEDDVRRALGGISSMSAGRTDKDVSAISQVVSCHTFDDTMTPNSIKQMFSNSEAAKAGRLALFDCAQVPRKFHSLFSATWRRYLYLFPLHVRSNDDCDASVLEEINGTNVNFYKLPYERLHSPHTCVDSENLYVDVDIDFVNSLLQCIENKELSYNGFAYKDLKKSNRGAFAHKTTTVNKTRKVDHDPSNATSTNVDAHLKYDDVSFRSNENAKPTEADSSLDKCKLLRASASVVDLTPSLHSIADSNHEEKQGHPQLALCVELVGTRFLRRMATAIRECQLPENERDAEVLFKICQEGYRDRSSMAITGEGLAMAGVGYDLHSLSIPKFGVTTTNQKRLRKKEMKRKLKEAQGQNDVS